MAGISGPPSPNGTSGVGHLVDDQGVKWEFCGTTHDTNGNLHTCAMAALLILHRYWYLQRANPGNVLLLTRGNGCTRTT